MTRSSGVMALVIFVSVRKRQGHAVIVPLAGLKSIPSECVEVTQVDGAKSWQVFRLATLPLPRPAILSVVVVMSLANINTVETPSVLTDGGPNDAMRFFVLEVYEPTLALLDLGPVTDGL